MNDSDDDAYQSVQLFVDRARAVRPDFAITENNRHAIAEICRRVDASLRLVTYAVRGRTMRPSTVSGAEDMVHQQWIRQARAELDEAVEHLHSLGFTDDQVSSEVAVGTSWGRAMDRIEWTRGDVLVVGSSSSSTLLSRVFLGSSAAKIVRSSPVPVIVVP